MRAENSGKTNFTHYPLLWLSVCFACGILIESFIGADWKIYFLFCTFFALISAFSYKRKFSVIFLFIAFILAGAFYFAVENQTLSADRLKNLYDTNRINSGDPIEIEGRLQKYPESSMDGVFLFIKTEKVFYKNENLQVSGNIRLFAPISNEQILNDYNSLELKYNSRIRIATHLQREDSFLNPGVSLRREILDQQEIDATGSIKSPLLIEKIVENESFTPFSKVYEYRQNLIENIRNTFNSETSGILIASLLGNRYFLDKKTSEVFREGGTFHVLVISGLHITFIGGLILLFARLFTKKRLWQFISASAILWVYALAVGAEVPVVRAALMFTILLFSQVIYRRGTLLNALGACILILLVWRPNDLFNQSFHLTVTSVTAIIAMGFPLIENLRTIGSWTPSAETPFPPNVSPLLKRFCETIYWRENIWKRDISQQIWSAKLFKMPFLKRFAENDWQKIFRYFFELTVISAVVQIWLLPFLIVYFHRFSYFSLLLNLFVGINIALESVSAMFSLFLTQINQNLAAPFVKFTELLNWFLLVIPEFLIEKDIASARIPVYSGNFKAVYFIYFIPVIALTLILIKWNPFSLQKNEKAKKFKFGRYLLAIFGLLFSLMVFHPFSLPSADGRLKIDFLDVGQGDSALITFPNGETMLVDGGGKMNFNKIYLQNDDDEEPQLFEADSQSIGESVVSEFLWEKGYSKIDYILATHADADHIQGLSDVAKNFRVGKAFFARTPFKDEDFQKLFSILEKRRVDSEILSRGDIFNVGNVRIEILYPEKISSPENIWDNNNSLVLRVIFGDRKILMTGDIERETEKFLSENSEVQADVIKVAHHGSRTSSIPEFIEGIKAEYAIIPVGRKSPFGHPHKEIVERWQKSGAKIITTGERGTVSISTDGKDLTVETFIK